MRGHIANMQVQPPSHRYKADLDHDRELHVGLVYYYQGRYVLTRGTLGLTSHGLCCYNKPTFFVIQDMLQRGQGSI